jgi:hypothetical protein
MRDRQRFKNETTLTTQIQRRCDEYQALFPVL